MAWHASLSACLDTYAIEIASSEYLPTMANVSHAAVPPRLYRRGVPCAALLMLSHLILIGLNYSKEITKVYTMILFRLDHEYKYSLNNLKTVK